MFLLDIYFFFTLITSADSSAEDSPNAPEFICPICLLKPKSSGFQKKGASFGVRSPWFLALMLTFKGSL